MKRKKRKNKSIYIICICLVLFFLFIFSVCIADVISSNKKFDVTNIIVNNDYDVVYDMGDSPIINLSGEYISKINQEINDYYSLNSNGDKFDYDFNVSEDTLSILLTRHIIVENKEYIEYKSYNIDLINMRDLSYDEILNKFGVTSDDLSFFMKNKFLNYYADLLDKGYLDGTKCDFNCFLVNCNFQDLDEDNVLYIKKNHLYLYKFFNIYTDYNYNEYFSYDDFVFNVK